MNYQGFTPRDYLLLKYIPRQKYFSVLEIGPGLGSLARKISPWIKEYYGVDISQPLIKHLRTKFKNLRNTAWYCLDVCQSQANLNKKFDFIVSADTLEHVSSSQRYFEFIKRHLKNQGRAIITFPNESIDKAHGITRFKNLTELKNVITKEQLKIRDLQEIKLTRWHKTIRKILWDIPKSPLHYKEEPQSFEKTRSFQLDQRRISIKTFLAIYSRMITKLTNLLPAYSSQPVEFQIQNRILLIILTPQRSKRL